MVSVPHGHLWYKIEVSAGGAAQQRMAVPLGAAHPSTAVQSLTPGEERHFLPTILLASLEP